MSNAPRIGSRLDAPKGLRLYIGLFGRRNAGKSSLINALTNQNLSIVSDVAGTTTDAVEKACELAPIGPVVFIDTAGVDDVGALGQLRVDDGAGFKVFVERRLAFEHEQHADALARQDLAGLHGAVDGALLA